MRDTYRGEIYELHYPAQITKTLQLNQAFFLIIISAKFDPPTILKIETVPRKHGCLKLHWRLSQNQTWMHNQQLNLDVRYRTADSSHWIKQPVSMISFSANN